jgi:hypothetical protein
VCVCVCVCVCVRFVCVLRTAREDSRVTKWHRSPPVTHGRCSRRADGDDRLSNHNGVAKRVFVVHDYAETRHLGKRHLNHAPHRTHVCVNERTDVRRVRTNV